MRLIARARAAIARSRAWLWVITSTKVPAGACATAAAGSRPLIESRHWRAQRQERPRCGVDPASPQTAAAQAPAPERGLHGRRRRDRSLASCSPNCSMSVPFATRRTPGPEPARRRGGAQPFHRRARSMWRTGRFSPAPPDPGSWASHRRPMLRSAASPARRSIGRGRGPSTHADDFRPSPPAQASCASQSARHSRAPPPIVP